MNIIGKLLVVLLLVLLLVTLALYWNGRGVSHRELKAAVTEESAAIRQKLDERCDRLEKRLDGIDGKLDKLLELARPKLPDGMRTAE